MHSPIESQTESVINGKIEELENCFDSDAIFFYGPIGSGLPNEFREMICELKQDGDRRRLSIVLTTPGGSASEVERCVNVIRNYYDEVDFIVPDYAYSAGTIFCMSGDNIYMDFYSVLGPIDPQVQNKDKHWVAALGYLDKVNDMIERSKRDELSPVEILLMLEMDLGELREYEQAKELTVDLLKRWLVKYKFKSWTEHRSNPKKLNKPVTVREKEKRASEIAELLSDNNRWKAHGRPINIDILRNELKLEINDFSEDARQEGIISSYYNYLMDYIRKNGSGFCFHTRRRFIV